MRQLHTGQLIINLYRDFHNLLHLLFRVYIFIIFHDIVIQWHNFRYDTELLF